MCIALATTQPTTRARRQGTGGGRRGKAANQCREQPEANEAEGVGERAQRPKRFSGARSQFFVPRKSELLLFGRWPSEYGLDDGWLLPPLAYWHVVKHVAGALNVGVLGRAEQGRSLTTTVRAHVALFRGPFRRTSAVAAPRKLGAREVQKASRRPPTEVLIETPFLPCTPITTITLRPTPTSANQPHLSTTTSWLPRMLSLLNRSDSISPNRLTRRCSISTNTATLFSPTCSTRPKYFVPVSCYGIGSRTSLANRSRAPILRRGTRGPSGATPASSPCTSISPISSIDRCRALTRGLALPMLLCSLA